MTMQQRYHELLGRSGITTAKVARDAGIKYNTLNDWRKGKTKSISSENLSKLADYFGVPMSYFSGEDELTTDQKEMLKRIAVHEVAAGHGRIGNVIGNYDGDGQLARVVGDSMLPSLQDGDIVRFVEATDLEPSDFALVRIDGEALTVKHVEWTGEGLWVRAENKAVFADRFFTVKEITTIPVQVVGKAVEVRRAL